MLIFPAIDLFDGKAVRLLRGKYEDMTIYSEDPPSIGRDFAAAGARVWASKPCVVFANERFLAVHTKEGGEIKLSLPRKYARITDLLADKVVAENADSFTCTFSSPDTRLFDLSEND